MGDDGDSTQVAISEALSLCLSDLLFLLRVLPVARSMLRRVSELQLLSVISLGRVATATVLFNELRPKTVRNLFFGAGSSKVTVQARWAECVVGIKSGGAESSAGERTARPPELMGLEEKSG